MIIKIVILFFLFVILVSMLSCLNALTDEDFIKKYVEQHYNIDFDYEDLKKNYWFNETCQDSVPQAIYCFLISEDFEDCLRTTISIGGDCDTTAAISCAIAEAYYGIPKKIVNTIKTYLNEEMKEVLEV